MVLDEIPSVQSVAAGIWVRAGCVNEEERLSGISHFIEHMMFKGTARRTARQIAADTDALGAQMNAFTSKEYTCYYVRSLSASLDKVCEILLDMLTNSLFDPEEMEREKKVVMEEMKMVQDTPEDLVHDLLYEELFKGEPLHNSILGTPESLGPITHDDIVSYIGREYTLDNIVVSVSGNFDAEQVCGMFEEKLSVFSGSKPAAPDVAVPYVPSCVTRVKDIEQSHLVIGTRTFEFAHPDAYALTLLSNILGGTMSSRLFQTIREEKGLAYTVYSSIASHDTRGLFSISAGIAHEKVEDTVQAIREELEKLAADGITERELQTSKEQVKGSLIFGLENTSSRMVSNGKRALLRNRVRSQEEALRAVDAVTMDDVTRMIRMVSDLSTYSGALVGRRDLDLQTLLGR